jgi:hypothetical protein
LLPCSGGLAAGSRRRAAVRVRLGEKEALDATLRYFEDRISRWVSPCCIDAAVQNAVLGTNACHRRRRAIDWAPGVRSTQLNSTLHCVSVIVLVRVPLDPNRAPTRRLADMEYYAERRLKGLGLLDDSGNTTWDGFYKDSIA